MSINLIVSYIDFELVKSDMCWNTPLIVGEVQSGTLLRNANDWIVSVMKYRVSPSCTNVFSLCSHCVFIHTMEDDQRLNTLVHEDDTYYSKENCWAECFGYTSWNMLSALSWLDGSCVLCWVVLMCSSLVYFKDFLSSQFYQSGVSNSYYHLFTCLEYLNHLNVSCNAVANASIARPWLILINHSYTLHRPAVRQDVYAR